MAVCATSYQYDALNRLTLATFDGGNQVAYSYDDSGNLTQILPSVNGACGDSNTGTFTVAPATNLCGAGTAGEVPAAAPGTGIAPV